MLRLVALKDFCLVKKGDLGGLIEKIENLSQEGEAWVSGEAQVCGDAQVYGEAQVYGNAQVYGEAWVCGDAWVSGDSDMLLIGPMGSRKAFTTFFVEPKQKRIAVSCGCFYGSLDDFEKSVEFVHKGSFFFTQYLAAITAARTVLVIPEIKL